MRQQSVDPSRAGWVGVAWYCDAVPGVFTLLICMVGRTGEGGLPRAGGGGERRAQSKQEGPPARRTRSLLAASGTAASRLLHGRLTLQMEGAPQSAQEEGPVPHTACLRP